MASRASKEDLEFGKGQELLAAQLLVDRLWPGYKLIPCQTFAHIDFVVVNREGLFTALLEVKVRRTASTQYDSTAVNWEKHNAGRFAKRYFKVRTYCLVVHPDRSGFCFLDEEPDQKKWIGRADRGNQGCDHALYRHERFTWVEGLSEQLAAAQASPSDADTPPASPEAPAS